jgi:hypothetical protein
MSAQGGATVAVQKGSISQEQTLPSVCMQHRRSAPRGAHQVSVKAQQDTAYMRTAGRTAHWRSFSEEQTLSAHATQIHAARHSTSGYKHSRAQRIGAQWGKNHAGAMSAKTNAPKSAQHRYAQRCAPHSSVTRITIKQAWTQRHARGDTHVSTAGEALQCSTSGRKQIQVQQESRVSSAPVQGWDKRRAGCRTCKRPSGRAASHWQ